MSINSKKGFTLVELSIVLVIIGLLIGGILVAQSMISTAKVQATTRQLGQFDAAVANFYTKFNVIPGDNGVITAARTGNNDGRLGDGTAVTTVAGFDGEMGKFWYDLYISGIKGTGSAGTYADGSNNGAASLGASSLVNVYIPSAPIGTNVGVIAFGGGAGANYYALSSFATGATTSQITASPTSALKATDALAIDAKIDDAVATTGSVLGNTTGTVGTTGTAYVVTTTTPSTNLIVRMGLQSGNLQ